MIVATVSHFLFPFRFVPRNFAPGCGPVAPCSHLAPTFSGDHSPIRVRSETIAHTCSTGAAISRVTLTSSAIGAMYLSQVGVEHFRESVDQPVPLDGNVRRERRTNAQRLDECDRGAPQA